MSDTELSRELALRVGLAARVLPDVDVAGLLTVLQRCVGLPLDPERLAVLKPGRLRRAGGDDWADFDAGPIAQAAAILAGQSGAAEVDLPEVVEYHEGDMPASVRVAIASNGAAQVDGHFGSCGRFLVYQVSVDEIRLIDLRPAPKAAGIDKNEVRAELIADCHILYVMSIGGPAAAKVVRRGVHPVKHPVGGPAAELLGVLQSIMAGNPPPWLAKIMGQAPAQRTRFAAVAGEA